MQEYPMQRLFDTTSDNNSSLNQSLDIIAVTFLATFVATLLTGLFLGLLRRGLGPMTGLGLWAAALLGLLFYLALVATICYRLLPAFRQKNGR
jgi:F0F1-type ATP synthase assembly protein I